MGCKFHKTLKTNRSGKIYTDATSKESVSLEDVESLEMISRCG